MAQLFYSGARKVFVVVITSVAFVPAVVLLLFYVVVLVIAYVVSRVLDSTYNFWSVSVASHIQ